MRAEAEIEVTRECVLGFLFGIGDTYTPSLHSAWNKYVQNTSIPFCLDHIISDTFCHIMLIGANMRYTCWLVMLKSRRLHTIQMLRR